MGRNYTQNYPSVTEITDIASSFDPTGWYKGMRYQLLKKGVDLNIVDPIAECEKYRERTAKMGREVHDAIERFLRGEGWNEVSEGLTNQQKVMLSRLTTWVSENKPDPINLELSMESKKYEFCGTPDMICMLDGVLTVVDWKTDSVPKTKAQKKAREAKYYYQLGGYGILYQEEHKKIPKQGVICRADKKEGFEEFRFGKLETAMKEFKWLREIYRRVYSK